MLIISKFFILDSKVENGDPAAAAAGKASVKRNPPNPTVPASNSQISTVTVPAAGSGENL
jgi:hypothetical protein